MAIDLGAVQRLTFTNTTPDGTPASAATMALTITLPDDTTVVTSPVTPTDVGVYQHDYLTTQPGRHVAQWVGTGTNPGASVDIFDVRTASPGYLVSLAEMKDQLKLTTTDNDADLRGFIEAATDAVERIRNETIVRRTFTDEIYLREYFRGTGQVANAAQSYGIDTARFRVALSHSPALSLTSVVRVDNTMAWDVSNLHLDPDGIIDVLFGPTLVGHIAVTYVAGYRIVPESFTKAAEFIVQHLWQTRRGNKGSPRPGGMDVTTVPGIGFAVPNQAIELLGGGLPGIA